MKTNWIKSLTTGLVAALIAPTCACASQLTNKSPLRGVSSLSADSGLKIDFQNRSKFEFQAIGGGIDGSGGGSVIKCVVGGKAHYTLLDYQEAALKNIQVDLGAKTLSVGQKIETVLGRLSKVNPARAKHYAQLVNAYQDNVDMRNGVEFGKTPDVVDEIVPKGCERVQVVIQINPELPGDKRFVTNGDVWNQLDNETKAGIILHEIAYYDQGMASARKLRYFNAVMASPNLLAFSPKGYYEFLTSTSMLANSGFNPTPTTTCYGIAAFDADEEVLYARGCVVNEGLPNKWYSDVRGSRILEPGWGYKNIEIFFPWMKDISFLTARELQGQEVFIESDKNYKIQLGDVTFHWIEPIKQYFELTKGLDKHAYGLQNRRNNGPLFEISDSSPVKITTARKSIILDGKHPCPDEREVGKYYVDKILKSKVVLSYECKEDYSDYSPVMRQIILNR